MNPNQVRLRKTSHPPPRRIPSMHWLFRSNIPRKRNSYITPDLRKRNFFGMGEVLGVITNPAETVRSLTESKRLLDEARRELNESRERAQLRTKHTFSRLPGFFPRKAEILAIENNLGGEPSFTILFGASSVGKTALLREVLSREQYHVLHFDLRIAGFADLASLYMSLSQQMEQYFEEISNHMEGYQDFEREAWSFKHDRINVERRVVESSDTKGAQIRTSDVARLMELFQSSLLKYWEFDPTRANDGENGEAKRRKPQQDSDSTSDRTQIDSNGKSRPKRISRWGFRGFGKGKSKEQDPSSQRRLSQIPENSDFAEKSKEKQKQVKKMPVIFFDEAHKLPALIRSNETMKCLLDSMLVLTKQDRLCHVIHATSDPFYQTWLRQLNVMQHCKIITIGDCTKGETRALFRERVLPRVPERLREKLNFDGLYEAFGGKLAHWHDYITDFVNSDGSVDLRQSSHFLQAHALLNLHIIHSSQSPSANQNEANTSVGNNPGANASNADTLHPGLGPAGFRIYSPISNQFGPIPHGAEQDDRSMTMINGYYSADFTAMQLLKVMSRLSQPDMQYMSYFHLCREIGVRAVDGMVKGRVLDLRWTEPVSKDNGEEATRVRSSVGARMLAGSSSTAVEYPPPPIDDDEEMIPVSEHELGPPPPEPYDDMIEIIGPKLLPTTPIMRFAMREVVQEYEDDQSVSEYASLSEVDEY